MERGHSQRQACELIEMPRSILKYRSVRAKRDAPALDAMRRIAATYPRYGYRRVRIFLRREGHLMGPERAYRLWRNAGLQLPRRRPRRRVATSRPRPLPARGPNQVWAYDFVHDACANGQKLKCLTVIDEFTRECLAIDVAGSIRSARVIDECLSMEWFRSRIEARVLIEIWRRHYNNVRPHSSLDYRTPIEFRRHHETTHQEAILK